MVLVRHSFACPAASLYGLSRLRAHMSKSGNGHFGFSFKKKEVEIVSLLEKQLSWLKSTTRSRLSCSIPLEFNMPSLGIGIQFLWPVFGVLFFFLGDKFFLVLNCKPNKPTAQGRTQHTSKAVVKTILPKTSKKTER